MCLEKEQIHGARRSKSAEIALLKRNLNGPINFAVLLVLFVVIQAGARAHAHMNNTYRPILYNSVNCLQQLWKLVA